MEAHGIAKSKTLQKPFLSYKGNIFSFFLFLVTFNYVSHDDNQASFHLLLLSEKGYKFVFPVYFVTDFEDIFEGNKPF